jgi:ankyrin repeat protein
MSSRPETGRPGTWGNDQAEAEPENTEKIKTDVFGNIRHNKVAQVEDAFAAGFPIDSRDEHGNTALHISCQNGQKRLAKLCIKYGANPDTTNHMGNTSLHYAIGYGYEALSKYLISHGADDSIMNLNGQSPYEMVDKK